MREVACSRQDCVGGGNGGRRSKGQCSGFWCYAARVCRYARYSRKMDDRRRPIHKESIFRRHDRYEIEGDVAHTTSSASSALRMGRRAYGRWETIVAVLVGPHLFLGPLLARQTTKHMTNFAERPFSLDILENFRMARRKYFIRIQFSSQQTDFIS